MAIWQYIAYLIPEAAVGPVGPDGSVAGLTFGDSTFELPPLQFSISADDFERLMSSYLPPAKGWSARWHAWGDSSRDDAMIWYDDDGRIGDVRARLDLRDLTIERVTRLLALACQAGCCFLEGRTFQVVPATEQALVDSIRASRSAKFVADPIGFLEGLSREGQDRTFG